jgi:hypothetical protein
MLISLSKYSIALLSSSAPQPPSHGAAATRIPRVICFGASHRPGRSRLPRPRRPCRHHRRSRQQSPLLAAADPLTGVKTPRRVVLTDCVTAGKPKRRAVPKPSATMVSNAASPTINGKTRTGRRTATFPRNVTVRTKNYSCSPVNYPKGVFREYFEGRSSPAPFGMRGESRQSLGGRRHIICSGSQVVMAGNANSSAIVIRSKTIKGMMPR